VVGINRIVGFIALGLLLFLVITNPAGAAHLVQGIGGSLRAAAQSMTSFFQQLF